MEDEKSQKYHVGVVGAGLSGTLTALLLAKLGITVTLFEKRTDFRDKDADSSSVTASAFGTSTSATKRSINLALSHRGMIALKEVGALDTIMEHAVRMPCRVIHSVNAPEVKQAYGKLNEAIWSVSRQLINSTLLDMVTRPGSGVTIHFGHSFIGSSDDGTCTFRKDDGCANNSNDSTIVAHKFDLIIGADGAYSGVRESMLKKGRVNFSRQYIGHGYKELSIPAMKINNDTSNVTNSSVGTGSSEYEFALPSPEGLHIWPRGRFMLIAIPNPDKSFTATLFAPYQGEDGFDAVDPKNEQQVIAYFEKHFPDVVPLMPDLVADYRQNPVGSLITVRTSPWQLGKVLLLGDAAHAVVPFYGQGMNAGFQDGLMLYQIISRHIQSHVSNTAHFDVTGDHRWDLIACANEFARQRQPAADALADLCLEHYSDMASNTASSWYLLRKKLESMLADMFPKRFVPLYTMVAFTDTPYHEAVARAARQDQLLENIVLSGLSLIGVGMMGLTYWGSRKWMSQ